MRSKHSLLFRMKYERICDLYKQGNTAKRVGDIVGLSEDHVRTILKEHNVTIKRGRPMK